MWWFLKNTNLDDVDISLMRYSLEHAFVPHTRSLERITPMCLLVGHYFEGLNAIVNRGGYRTCHWNNMVVKLESQFVSATDTSATESTLCRLEAKDASES